MVGVGVVTHPSGKLLRSLSGCARAGRTTSCSTAAASAVLTAIAFIRLRPRILRPTRTQLHTIQESRGDVPPARGTPERVHRSPDAQSEARAPRRGSHSSIIVGGSVKHLTSHRAWPAQREARGLLTIKASPNHSKGMRAECSVQNDVLSLSIAESSGTSSGTVVAVPIEELAVGLQRGRTDMFIIATRNGDQLYDDISCFADDQEKRNKWIAVLRRMGVPIFDLSDGRNNLGDLVGRPVVF